MMQWHYYFIPVHMIKQGMIWLVTSPQVQRQTTVQMWTKTTNQETFNSLLSKENYMENSPPLDES